MPPEYLEFKLRTEVYKCSPAEMELIPMPVILRDLKMMGIEERVNQQKSGKKSSYGGLGNQASKLFGGNKQSDAPAEP